MTRVWAVELHGITKSFGYQQVLRGVDLRVKWGELVAVFGPNGAGKTTLLKILATLSRPSGGEGWVAGCHLVKETEAIRGKIGVVAHQTFLYDELTAEENLLFYGRMFRVANLKERVAQVLERVGLADRAQGRVGTFSRGMQQRLSIARGLIHDPQVLLLDEP